MKELKRGEESVLGEHFEDTGSFEETIDFKRFSKGLRSMVQYFQGLGSVILLSDRYELRLSRSEYY